MTGIYEIRCTANGKRYIGSAQDVDRRWGEHSRELRGGRHANARLQNAWNKYGPESFEWVILESDVPESNLIIREQFHLAPYLPQQRSVLFNIRSDARSNLGMVHSPEARQKISDANRERWSLYPRSREEILRTVEAAAAARRARTHCKRGHELTPENTYIENAGHYRVCRICRRDMKRALKARRRAGLQSAV